MRFTKPRHLVEDDDLSGFRSGKPFLDDWLRHRAKAALGRGAAVTYVTHAEDGGFAGFYSLSANSVNRDGDHGWLARNTPVQIPVPLLGMLAIDERYQGNGLGWRLLQDALQRSLSVSLQIGARALVVDPVDDEATGFYEHFGFTHIPDSARMFLKLV